MSTTLLVCHQAANGLNCGLSTVGKWLGVLIFGLLLGIILLLANR